MVLKTLKPYFSLDIKFKGTVAPEDIDLGSVTLKKDGRSYQLDITDSTWINDDHVERTSVLCSLEEDEETFDDCKYDLLVEDLLSPELKGTCYIEEIEDHVEIKDIILLYRGDESDFLTAIKLEKE